MTVEDLATEFTAVYIQNRLRPSTARGYMVNLRLHILPYWKTNEIEALNPHDLDALTETLKTSLSNKSIVYVHATARKMLNFAVKRGYIDKSPYRAFDLPRAEKYAYKVLDGEQLRKLFASVAGTPLQIPVLLAARYGLRRGECLGVIPALDLDSRENILHIQRTRSTEHGKEVITPCKTKNGNRYILLDDETANLLRVSPADKRGYVCPFTIYTLQTHFKKALQAACLPPVRFHDLRHSYATYMLSKGINPKIVCAVLGHSSVSVTLDIYSHPNVSMQTACLAAWDC